MPVDTLVAPGMHENLSTTVDGRAMSVGRRPTVNEISWRNKVLSRYRWSQSAILPILGDAAPVLHSHANPFACASCSPGSGLHAGRHVQYAAPPPPSDPVAQSRVRPLADIPAERSDAHCGIPRGPSCALQQTDAPIEVATMNPIQLSRSGLPAPIRTLLVRCHFA
jgi:hypothetical protein